MRLRRMFTAIALATGLVSGVIVASAPHAIAENWPTAAGSYTLSFTTTFDGRTRTYILHLPTGFSPSDGINRPLVLALHPGGGNASNFESTTGYSTKADANNFIVVYPQGTKSPGNPLNTFTWNASLSCCGYANTNNVNDVQFIRDLVSRLEAHYTIDTNQVFATGFSNGAILAYRLGCDASDIFAAVGPDSGDSTTLDSAANTCSLGGRTVSVVNLHGDTDTNEPYAGGYGSGPDGLAYQREPVETPDQTLYNGQTDIGQWTGYDGCSLYSTNTTSAYVQTTYCSSGVQVVNYKVLGGVHTWYQTSDGINATDTTWSFFSTHHR
jgi:polyhydroxybutyrate depolymerase